MEWIVMIEAVVILVLTAILVRQHINMRKTLQKMREVDKALTQYASAHVDLQKKLSELKQDYKSQKNMADEIKQMREQSRALKHDMKNHTLVIISYLEENRTCEAKQYAGNILDKLNRMYTYVNVGNSLLSYIINNKLSKAKQHGIEIKAEIENLSFGYMDSLDFSSLFNNILDNAIQAAAEAKRKVLIVNVQSKKGFDVISVKNGIKQSILETNPELATTKKGEGHGIGMKQIRKVVEKYDGTLDIGEEGDLFSLRVCFPQR